MAQVVLATHNRSKLAELRRLAETAGLRVLGLDDTGKAVSRLDDDELTRIKIGSGGQMREAYAVNESGLYALVLGSRKPEAKAFKRWVTHEVLPAIRRTGRYQADGVQPITPASIRQALTRYPAMTLGVVARIHWQAFRLWRKRVRFFSKPLPPKDFVTR